LGIFISLYYLLNNNILKFLFFSISALLLHPWTFIYYIIPIIYTIITSKKYVKNNVFKNKQLIVIFIILIIYYLTFSNNPLKSIIITILTFKKYDNFWNESIFLYNYLYGGFLSNVFYILLSIIGILIIYNYKDFKYNFINNLNVIILFLYLISDDFIKSRLIYNYPFYLFASIGTNHIITKYHSYKNLKLLIILIFINYYFIYMFNMS